MSPRKLVQNRKPKLPKPPLNMPKVKIGSTGKPPKIEKIISREKKIELANEVALAQLQRPSTSRKSYLPTTQASTNSQESVQIPRKQFTPETDGNSSSHTMKTPLLNPVVLVRNKQWEVKRKIAKPITKANNIPKRKKQQKKPVAVKLGDVLGNTELGNDQVCMNIAATLRTKQKRGRPKKFNEGPGKTLRKNKNLTTKEIQAAASMLEHALGIWSQPNSCSNSVVSARSYLSWTRDISSESSLLSYPGLTYMTGTTSNDIVMFNNKLPQIRLEKLALRKVNVTTAPSSEITRVNSFTQACLPQSVLSNDVSSSSDSESSSSSSSDSEHLNTSSLTSRVPISDLNIGQHLSILTKKMKNFHSDIQKFDDNVDDDFCSLSEILECIKRDLKAFSPVQNTSTNLPDTSYCNEVPFDRPDNNDDDDDALSIYAGSISGLESLKLDSVAPVSNSRDIKTALEEDSNHLLSHAEGSIKRSEAQASSQPRRLFSSYQKINPVRSSLYRGVCFFYIASHCKNSSCRFTHAILTIKTLKFRLKDLDEDTLIAEYLLMCVYESLKRKYYLLFVEECNRRKATRILFEMVIDLGLGFVSIDEDIRVKVLETSLLHLNTISIDACEDLLQLEHEGTMMCDALLSCMANSQNFVQFKPAFVKLANLMCELNRPVDIQVASSILERVCILPGEDLARGMLALMKNTDVSIFENSLACSFELQLANIDSDVHAAYLLAKKAALEDRLAQLDEAYPTTPPIMPCVVLNAPRQTRPDSNKMGNLPETKEMVFKRTINSESLQNYLKPPANPVLKPFLIPKLSQTSRCRHDAKGPRR